MVESPGVRGVDVTSPTRVNWGTEPLRTGVTSPAPPPVGTGTTGGVGSLPSLGSARTPGPDTDRDRGVGRQTTVDDVGVDLTGTLGVWSRLGYPLSPDLGRGERRGGSTSGWDRGVSPV